MNVFDLAAKITLDTSDYENGLDDAGKKTSSFSSKLQSGLKTAAKVGAVAVTAAGTAIGAIVKKGVDAYTNYEQLVGGVETLFGAGGKSLEEYAASVGKTADEASEEYDRLITAQELMLEQAEGAYKTAGLSANQYMEQATSFAASLVSSLGGDTLSAVELADIAISDMSDNANKMGTDVGLIQNAYQGFAKQNYTMLDNLKLGYGGTKEEMERLIADANRLQEANGQMADLSIDSYADIVKAIHVVQTEMGIYGTTAKEASETISGSVASAKAAWQNLITVMSTPDIDMDILPYYVEQFTDSVKTAAGNIIPVVSQALIGIGQVIQDLAPIISEQLPVLIETVLPSLLDAGTNLLMGVINGIITALPNLIDPVIQLVSQFGNFIIENLPLLINAALQIIVELANGIVAALPELIPAVVDVILQIVDSLIDNLDMLVDVAIEIILALTDGLIDALPRLLEKAPEIITKLVNALINNAPKLLSAGAKAVGELVGGIINNLPEILSAAGKIISTIWEGLRSLPGKALQWGKDMLQSFIDGITAKIGALVDKIKGVGQKIKNFLGFSEPDEGPLSNFHTYAPDMMKLFAKGIADNEDVITNQLEKSFAFRSTISSAMGDYRGYGSYGTALSGATFNITVNGANIQDDQSLAERIAFEIQQMVDRKEAMFGAA